MAGSVECSTVIARVAAPGVGHARARARPRAGSPAGRGARRRRCAARPSRLAPSRRWTASRLLPPCWSGWSSSRSTCGRPRSASGRCSPRSATALGMSGRRSRAADVAAGDRVRRLRCPRSGRRPSHRAAPGDPARPARRRRPACSAGLSSATRRRSSPSPCSRSPGMAMANVLLPSLVKRHYPDRIGTMTVGLHDRAGVRPDRRRSSSPCPIAEAFGSWRAGLGGLGRARGRGRGAVAGPGRPRRARPGRGGRPGRAVSFRRRRTHPARLGDGRVLRAAVDAGVRRSSAGSRRSGATRATAPTAAGALVGVVAGISIPLSAWVPAADRTAGQPAVGADHGDAAVPGRLPRPGRRAARPGRALGAGPRRRHHDVPDGAHPDRAARRDP